MKILVIAPHMDDEVLGAGGTIARHVSEGDDVYVCFVAHRIYGHKFDKEKNKIERKYAMNAKKILGYKEAKFLGLSDERLDVAIQDIIIPLEKYVGNVRPDVSYINHGGDNNQDHKAVFQAAMVVLRTFSSPTVKRILSYEVPSSTEQSQFFARQIFMPNYYVNIEKHLGKKIRAIKAYKTELRQFPHPRSAMAIKTLAMKRGTEIGFKAAEAFMVIREKWE
jgi:LmbE family N-acetylglucosaminyl deacetylase